MVSNLFGQTKLYEPSPRFSHCAAAVAGRCFLWGGHAANASEHSRKKLSSAIEIFDPYLETWEQHTTTGVPPPGLYGRGYTSLLDSLYWFGGRGSIDCMSFYNSLHRLDPTTLEWRELHPLNQADGPMRKWGCGMVPFLQDKLAIFGGYGIPRFGGYGIPTGLGAMFTEDTFSIVTRGIGWSNELHVFDITKSKWFSPPDTGPRPPPSSAFSFTAINNHQAVLFGGLHPGYCQVNDCYFIDFESMEWTKLERPVEAPWPVERCGHATCCLNYGEEHPQLLVTGGLSKNDTTLSDAWILDVKSGSWKTLILPEDAQPRAFHTATALSLWAGRTQVIIFGGRPTSDVRPKLADSTVLEFESVESQPCVGRSPTKEWVLMGVFRNSQLGSVQRIRERIFNLHQRAIQEAEAHQQTLQEAHTLGQRVKDAEERAQDLQTQLESSQNTCQELQQSLQSLSKMSEKKVPKVAVPVESDGTQLYRASLYYMRKGVNWRDIHFVITQEAHHTEYVREKYIAEGATVGPNLRVEFQSKSISLELPSVDVILNDGWKIIPVIPPEITKEVVDSYSFENGWGIPSCQLIALWTAQSRPSQLIHTVALKGTKKPSYFSIVLDSDSIPLASRAPTPDMRELMDVLYHKVADKWEHIGIYLHLPMPTLKVIAGEQQCDPHKCLIRMLEAWLKRVDPPPTWSAIIEAMEFLGEEQLARQIREKY